ncbi:MAG: VWA domain-containing protein [Phycisphaerales bacterium]
MNLTFEHPWALLLLLLALPLAWMAWRSVRVLGAWKSYGALALRIVVLLLLTFALSRPSFVRESDAMSVLVVADESDSVPLALRRKAEESVREAVGRKPREDDRVGVVTVARDPIIAAMPAQLSEVVLTGHVGDMQATDLAGGLRMALATQPPDTTARVLLLSDGNETSGSLLEAADLARAAGVPIDVVPLEYQHASEVLVESLRAPTRAREGQSIDLRAVIRSQKAAKGKLMLWQNDEPVDLDPDSDSLGLPVDLQPGPNLITLPVVANGTGAQRFRVLFEPADPAMDIVPQNNAGAAVVFVGGTGRVLVIAPEGGQESNALETALREGKIEVERLPPEAAMGRGLAYLAGFDCVVLANVPRWAFDNDFDRAMHAYAHDLGGGLVMLGGPESFGAGGWLGSETAKALPVRMDPPQTRQILRGALAILLHSCEMAEGNYWGQQVALAAIGALSSQDYIGLLSYGGGGFSTTPRPGDRENYGWGFPLQLAGDKTAANAAARGMLVGDMPGFQIPLEMVHDEMVKLRAGQKHAIVITDGDPSAPTPELLNDFKAAKITVTTVMVGGHGTAEDNRKMQAIANKAGGRFYKVDNPRKLPQIFIQEATLVARSLIVEGDFQPSVAVVPGGPTAGFDAVPSVRGYILTVPREGLAQMPMVVRTKEGNDPIYAYWNYGLGRSIAFTPDLGPRWGPAWTQWSRFQAFWEQGIRWTMRPAMPQDVSVSTRVDGDRAFIDVQTREQQGGFAASTRAEARLVAPDGKVVDLALRQTGPGSFAGEFPTQQSGAYLANITFARAGDGGEARAGSVQAAVSVPYAAEYRATRDNAALLRSVAERTGGRVLRLADSKTWDLFDRTTLGVSQTARTLWDLSAILAAVMILIDVAWRRISFDKRDAQELAARVTGGALSAGTGGVDALRRARQGAQGGGSGPAGTAGAGGAGGAAANAGTRFEASADGPKIDARNLDSGAPGPGEPGARRPARDEPAAPSDDPLARLRAARRRAQHRDDQPDPPAGEGSGG